MAPARSDTALGDWCVNRIVVDRQPLLLLVSSASLLAVLSPARDVRRLPERLAALVGARLKRLGIDDRAVDAETRAMAPVVVAPPVDRSVLGIMVDYAKLVPYYLGPGRWGDETLPWAEERLAENPCFASRPFDCVIPKLKTPELLRAKWLAEGRM